MHNQHNHHSSHTEQQSTPDEPISPSDELQRRAERVEQLAKDVSFSDADETLVKKSQPPPETKVVDPRATPPLAYTDHPLVGKRIGLRFEFEATDFPPARIEINEELVVGRVGKDTELQPDLDLTPFGAVTHGVSRQHVKVIKSFNTLHIMDLGSTNGTYLNGELLFIGQPHVLHNGDVLRLGTLSINVFLERLD